MISTGIGTIVGGILTGLATWKTMSAQQAASIDAEQASWRAELMKDATELRSRVTGMQKEIDELMNERRLLNLQITELSIKLVQHEATIASLKRNQTQNDIT